MLLLLLLMLLLRKRLSDRNSKSSRLVVRIVVGLLNVGERSLGTDTRRREDLGENHAPRHTAASARDIDAGRDHHATLHALRKHLIEAALRESNGVTLLIDRIHPDLSIPDRDLHAERRGILSIRNPLAIDLLNARRENRLECVANNSLGASLAKPAPTVLGRRGNDLLREIQEEVVELTDLTAIRGALLCVGVAALQGSEQAVTVLALLIRACDHAGRIEDARNANLERLPVILDGNGLTSSLVGANLANGDAGDVQVLRRDDCSGSHVDLL